MSRVVGRKAGAGRVARFDLIKELPVRSDPYPTQSRPAKTFTKSGANAGARGVTVAKKGGSLVFEKEGPKSGRGGGGSSGGGGGGRGGGGMRASRQAPQQQARRQDRPVPATAAPHGLQGARSRQGGQQAVNGGSRGPAPRRNTEQAAPSGRHEGAERRSREAPRQIPKPTAHSRPRQAAAHEIPLEDHDVTVLEGPIVRHFAAAPPAVHGPAVPEEMPKPAPTEGVFQPQATGMTMSERIAAMSR